MELIKKVKVVDGKKYANFYLVCEVGNGKKVYIAVANKFKDDFTYMNMFSRYVGEKANEDEEK